jgi:hypothetical protein
LYVNLGDTDLKGLTYVEDGANVRVHAHPISHCRKVLVAGPLCWNGGLKVDDVNDGLLDWAKALRGVWGHWLEAVLPRGPERRLREGIRALCMSTRLSVRSRLGPLGDLRAGLWLVTGLPGACAQ